MRLEPEDCLKQLEAEHIIIAELLINRSDVTEVTSMHGDSRFHRKARQVARFQEEIEGIKDALQEARAEQRSGIHLSQTTSIVSMIQLMRISGLLLELFCKGQTA